MLTNNRIINKIKNQYKQAVYIDKNGNKNTNISLINNNNTFRIINKSADLAHILSALSLKNNSFNIRLPQYYYTKYLNNIKAGIYGNSFVNHNGDQVDIEFHIKHFNLNTSKKILQQLERKYKKLGKPIPLNDFLDIEEQLNLYIIKNFYLGVLMIFINGIYESSEPYYYHYNQLDQLKTLGKQLIDKYSQQYL